MNRSTITLAVGLAALVVSGEAHAQRTCDQIANRLGNAWSTARTEADIQTYLQDWVSSDYQQDSGANTRLGNSGKHERVTVDTTDYLREVHTLSGLGSLARHIYRTRTDVGGRPYIASLTMTKRRVDELPTSDPTRRRCRVLWRMAGDYTEGGAATSFTIKGRSVIALGIENRDTDGDGQVDDPVWVVKHERVYLNDDELMKKMGIEIE